MKKNILFLISHIGQLYKYYFKTILTGEIAAVITILAIFTKDFLVNYPNLYLVLRYGPWIIFFILFSFSLADLFIYRLSGTGLTINYQFLDGYYSHDSHYTLVERTSCHNNSKHPIRDLLEVREGYHENPSNVTCQIKPLNKFESHNIEVSNTSTNINKKFSSVSTINDVQINKWIAHVSPPIKPGEDFDYLTIISAQNVEEKAFENFGTLFSWVVPVRSRKLVITIHPPYGFVVDLKDYSVEDENGQTLKKERSLIFRPQIVSEGTVLCWTILFPKPNARYGVRYLLKKL